MEAKIEKESPAGFNLTTSEIKRRRFFIIVGENKEDGLKRRVKCLI